ncbi:dihydroneopterin aldolase [Paracoccus methylarcula]|uniref:dihydroneopterin aldolase n=1 Tax=Paracoccus methylarcula TaxID=72022 RepID=A0A3R7SDC6_9RHOB|nr:dihydroneopterin aldolase [Paracoccus methylarcula]RNF35457.1 dihydroneopterin aldolase [Paracoccus methylarcula]
MEIRDRIHLRDHVVAADIGAFQSERGNPQRLRFNLTVELRDLSASQDDQVDSVLSYDVLTQAVAVALADQRYNLVETLAERIAAEVLAHPAALRIEVCVEKLDRGPGALGITISRDQSQVPAEKIDLPAKVLLWTAPAALPDGAVIVIPDRPGLPLPDGGDTLRIALLALDQAAWALAGKLGLEVAESRTELDAAVRAAHPVIWAPARLAVDIDGIGADPLALAAWLADRIGAEEIEMALPDGAALPKAPKGCRARIAHAAKPKT